MPKILDLSGCGLSGKDITLGKRGTGDGALAVQQAAMALAGAKDFDMVVIGVDNTDFDAAVVAFCEGGVRMSPTLEECFDKQELKLKMLSQDKLDEIKKLGVRSMREIAADAKKCEVVAVTKGKKGWEIEIPAKPAKKKAGDE